jgi:hypothetical protein
VTSPSALRVTAANQQALPAGDLTTGLAAAGGFQYKSPLFVSWATVRLQASLPGADARGQRQRHRENPGELDR